MKKTMFKKTAMVIAALAIAITGTASATFTDFVIRHGSSGAPAINPHIHGLEFVINEGGMKAGLGSNDINGATVGQIEGLTITRYDDTTRFTAGSGPAVAPYFNLWVTDGLGNYAVIANEPSNPAFHSLFIDNGDGSKTYDLDYADLANKAAKVYETPGWNTGSLWVHALFGAGPLTFADVASLEIAPPPPAYILNGANGVGSGAPDEIGTNVAYGVNWVFGDTLSHYVSGDDGYIVGNAGVSSATAPVPEPATISLLLMGLGGLAARARRKKS